MNVTFQDVKKFDVVNPVIGKLATQVKESKLTDYKLTKKLLGRGEREKLENWFELFKEGLDDIINDDNDEDTGGIGGGRGGGREGGRDGGTPPRQPPDLYGGHSPAENSRRIAQANKVRFQTRRLRDRQRKISNIPRGIVKSRKGSIDINFPEMSLPTPYRD